VNTCALSGWLPEDAGWGYRDAATPVLMFWLVARDAAGADHRLKCRVEDPARARQWEPLLTRGRAVLLRAEAVAIEVQRHGYTKAETTAFRVVEAEFPNRSAPKAAPVADDEGEGEAAGAAAPANEGGHKDGCE
jgi:hypothetical protein